MLLRTDSLPLSYSVIAEMNNLGFINQKLFIVTSKEELIFIKKAPTMFPDEPEKNDEPGLHVFQTEFPLAAAPWIVDTIENKLWRSAAEGGLPSGTYHYDEIVGGEDLRVRRSMNVGAQGQKGFSLLNFSRPHLKFSFENYQELQVTDMLLREGGLLDVLRRIQQ